MQGTSGEEKNGSIYNTKGSTRPVGDPEATVKLFELFRARCSEQITRKSFISIKSSKITDLISKF